MAILGFRCAAIIAPRGYSSSKLRIRKKKCKGVAVKVKGRARVRVKVLETAKEECPCSGTTDNRRRQHHSQKSLLYLRILIRVGSTALLPWRY